MAATDILLRIGTAVGPGGFASIQSAIQMTLGLVSAIAQQVDKTDALVVAMRNANMEIVNYADSQSKMQIGTKALVDSFNSFSLAGAKIAKQDFATMAKAAESMADVLQISGAEAMDQLTSALIRGSDRGLKPLGIKIDENNKSMTASEQIMKQLRDRYADSTVELENMTDAITFAKNAFGDFTTAAWDGVTRIFVGPGGVFTNVIIAIDKAAAAMTELDNKSKDWYYSLERIKLTALAVFSDSASQELSLRDQIAFYQGLVDKRAQQSATPQTTTLPPPKPSGPGKSREAMTPEELYIAKEQEYANALAGSLTGPRRDFVPDILGASTETMSFIGAEGGDRESSLVRDTKYAEAAKQADLLFTLEADAFEAEMEREKQRAEWVEAEENASAQRRKDQLIEDAQEKMLFNSREQRARRMSDSVEQMADSWMSLRSSIGIVMQAYEQGTQGMTKAAATMYYIDCIMNIVIEGARAAASFAKGPAGIAEGVLHVIAAGAFVAAAAVAASHGGSSSSGTGSMSAVGPSATAGQYSGGYNRSDNQNVTVHITMNDSAKLLGFVVDENDRAQRAGDRHFVKAA